VPLEKVAAEGEQGATTEAVSAEEGAATVQPQVEGKAGDEEDRETTTQGGRKAGAEPEEAATLATDVEKPTAAPEGEQPTTSGAGGAEEATGAAEGREEAAQETTTVADMGDVLIKAAGAVEAAEATTVKAEDREKAEGTTEKAGAREEAGSTTLKAGETEEEVVTVLPGTNVIKLLAAVSYKFL
jgi:hypothetical protein